MDHFAKALNRDLETLIQALLSPLFSFRNISVFVESFDPILRSEDNYAGYLKKVIQYSVFYYYLLMNLRCSINADISKVYPFYRLNATESQKECLSTIFEKFRDAFKNNNSVHDILFAELTENYKTLIYNEATLVDLNFNVDAVWEYLLEVGPQRKSINISELYSQKVNAAVDSNKKVTNFEITEDMLEDEP